MKLHIIGAISLYVVSTMAASAMNRDVEVMEVEQETENALPLSSTQQPDTNPTPASEEPANQETANKEPANQIPSTSADNNKISEKIVYPSPAYIEKDIEKFVEANPELLKNFDGNFNSCKELIGLFNGIIVKYSPIYSRTDGDKCWLQSVCASIMFKALDKYEIMFERFNNYVVITLQTIEKKNQFYDKVLTRICGTELVPSIKPNGVDSTKAENDQVKKPKRKTNKEKKEEYEEHVYANIMIKIYKKCQTSYDCLKLFIKYPAITHRNLELILTKSISPKAFIFSSLIVESLKLKEIVKDESKASDQEVKDESKANDKEIKENTKAEENQDESKDSDQEVKDESKDSDKEIKENIKAEENQHEQISDIYDWVQSFYDAYVRLLFKISIKQYFDDSKESFKSGVKESNIKTFTEKFEAFYTEYAIKDEETRKSEAKANQHKNLKDLFWDDILTKVEPAYVTILRAFCYADKSIRNIITDEKRFLQKMKELNTDCLESTRITYNTNNITVCDVHHTLILMPIGAFGKLPFHCYAGIVYGCFPKIISETGPGMYVHNDIQSRVEYDFRELEKVESIVAEYECLREKLGKFAFIHDELVACKLHEKTKLTLLNATKLAIAFAEKIGKENLILYFKTSEIFSKDLEVVNIVINQVTKDGRYFIEVSNAKEDVRSFYPVFQCASGKEGMKESPTSSIEIGAFDLFIAEEVRRSLSKLQNAGIPATAN